jgi:glutamate carboxypeptidase
MKEIIEKIDNDRAEMVSLLKEWSNINSGTENIAGLSRMLEALKNAFVRLGGKMETISLPPRKRINPHGKVIEQPLGQSLLIQKHTHSPVKVFLAGHMDIALAPHHRFLGCKQLDNNTLCGQGTADMKGGLVILLKSLEALEKSPLAGKIGWTVLINSDEEIGSPGSTPLFTQLAPGHKFGLIFEPSFPDGSLVSSRKGSLTYTAIARGKAAHVGRDFHKGKNALTSIAKFALAADHLTNEEKGTTVNLGIFEGGGPVNIVPDLGICRFNVRAQTNDEMKSVQKNIEQIAEEMNIELFQDSRRAVKEFDENTKALFQRVAAHAKNFDLKWKPTGGVCDGNNLAARGIPTIDTLGVVGGKMHTPEEYALIDSLTERAKWTTSLLLEEAEWTH